MWLLVLLLGAPRAADVAPEPYTTAIKLIDRWFLYPDRIDPQGMLLSSARALEHDLPWLVVSSDRGSVLLSKGDGTKIGEVSVASMEELPASLQQLVALVAAATPAGEAISERLPLVALDGVVDSLDRHSRVLTDDKLDRFNERLTGTLVGIGASFVWSGDELLVSEILPQGPADQGGIQLGDEVLRIDGRSTVSMPMSEASRRVRGEPGTQVSLTVRRGNKEINVGLTRAEVVLPNVSSRVLPGKVGYVSIDHVSQQTVENLRAALADLDQSGALDVGLVIDLRGNTGGSMKESASVADLFLDEGLLLRTAGADGGHVQNLQAEMLATRDGTEPEIPIVVVVDDRTASGSEIMAGALEELGRAAIIGERTYGKGTVQKVYPLAPDVRLKLTVARYILANGREIHESGITPDVVVGEIDIDDVDASRPLSVRYIGWDESWQQTPWSRIVPEVQINGEGPDLALEIARRALLVTEGTRREDIVASLEREASVMKTEQQEKLASAYTARGIDWSQAPASGPAAIWPVQVRSERVGPDTWRLSATVQNPEQVDLHRVLVQLNCATVAHWDDVVIPVGLVRAGETAAGSVEIELPPGIEARQDAVTVKVRADGRPPSISDEQILDSGSSAPPLLRVRAKLADAPEQLGPHGHPVKRAHIVVQNLSRAPIEGAEVHFGFPKTDTIELLDHGVRIPAIGARAEVSVDLAVEVKPGSGHLSLDLAIDTDRYGILAWWPLSLPADGSEVALQAPQIEARPPSRSAPIGVATLPITITDDQHISYAVVSVNGEKVAFADARALPSARLQLSPTFELLPGENIVVIETQDDQGLRSVKTVAIRGDASLESMVDASQ